MNNEEDEEEEDNEIPLTENELLTFLEDLEETNISIFNNIQADEVKMEEDNAERVVKFKAFEKDLGLINETI